MKKYCCALMLSFLWLSPVLMAQGEDSQPYDRDLQVITTMLEGIFDNRNQTYFDTRGSNDVLHRRLHVNIDSLESTAAVQHGYIVTSYWDNDKLSARDQQIWAFSTDRDRGAVKMRAYILEEQADVTVAVQTESLVDLPFCEFFWQREAEQFRAATDSQCSQPAFDEIVLGARQLWLNDSRKTDADFKLHRAREFECYVDIPGVGGGRDEDYNRYDGFKIHDQGGEAWFETVDGREIGISLWLVDWPINNYKGIFTRDSFVIYVNEKTGDTQKQHGYSFTMPEVDRLGINLKWLLASCFMKSNEFATPSM